MLATRFEELDVWKNARQLCVMVVAATRKYPFKADDVLRRQIYRAALSVVSNVAEGFESRTNGLCKEFFGRAKGSAGEVRAQVYIAKDLGYLDDDTYTALLDKARHCSSQIQRFISQIS